MTPWPEVREINGSTRYLRRRAAALRAQAKRDARMLQRDEPKPERDRIVGAWLLGILMVVILIGIAVDAFVRPAYWLGGMP